MSLKTKIKRLEEAVKKKGGGKHVILITDGKTDDAALKDYEKDYYVNPSDEIVCVRMNLMGKEKKHAN